MRKKKMSARTKLLLLLLVLVPSFWLTAMARGAGRLPAEGEVRVDNPVSGLSSVEVTPR